MNIKVNEGCKIARNACGK